MGGHHGDLEHVRGILGKGMGMEANTMYWLTDRTPHETLPVKEDTYRQFFRVVTSKLSAWFPEHSTANRLGIKPDSAITKIIEGNKFSDDILKTFVQSKEPAKELDKQKSHKEVEVISHAECGRRKCCIS